jgi:ATP-dependent protease ClpP protease subunit
MPFIEVPDRIPGLRAQARGDQPWYRIKNVSSDEAEIFLYDEVGGWGTYADQFVADLKAITAPKIRLRINSPGGSVFEGLACANALRAHPAEVIVQVDGIAASIASVIAMAADRVIVQPQAMLMLHDAAGVCLGNAQDMQDMAALLDKISGNIADAYASKAGGTRDDWRQVMVKETWYTAEEAVAAGLADEVGAQRGAAAEPDAEPDPEMRQEYDLTAYGYQGPAKPETPKSAPEAAEPTLVISIADALDEDTMARLRAAVQPPAAEPVVEPEPVLEPEVPAEPEPAAEPEPIEPAEPAEPGTQPEPAEDDWTAMVASLIPDDTDGWSALVSNLIEPDTSSSAATA